MDQPISAPSAPRSPFPWRHVVVSVIATGIVVGAGALYLGAAMRNTERWERIREIADLREDNAILRERIESPLTDDQLLRGLTETFLDLALPPEPFDYTAAATLLMEPLAAELRRDPSAIPRWLGIQDGPDAFVVFSSQMYETTATVSAGAFFGTPTGLLTEWNADRRWKFRFTRTNDDWRISSIEVRK